MSTRLSLLCALVCNLTLVAHAQEKPNQATPADAEHDVVELRAGERLTGQIVKETRDYIELKIGLGTVVGFDKSRVVRIIRASHSKTKAKPKPLAIPKRDRWYVLHDGQGKCVGRLHETVQVTERGELRIAEEWQFTTKNQATEITILETVDRDLTPISCFYHERQHVVGSHKLTHERLVQGKVKGGKLTVQRRTLQDRKRRKYRFPRGTGFRMAILHELRNNADQRIHEAYEDIYDPVREEFYRLRVVSRPRHKVEWKGHTTHVRQLRVEAGKISSVEWLDGQRKTLRREVNGLHLVATPVDREPDAAAMARKTIASALVHKEGFPYAMWIPNPTWRVVKTEQPQLRLEAPLYEASASLFELDQIEKGKGIETAADTLERWLQLTLGKNLRVRARTETTVRGKPARRLDVNYYITSPGRSRAFQCRAFVFRPQDRWVVLCCIAPRADFEALEDDFGRVCETVELHKAGFAPKVQGPLATKPAK